MTPPPTTLATTSRVFFSLPQVTQPDRHRDYNRWHQLDHQPENLALGGVLHGDRWVRTPACRAAGIGPTDPTLDLADYVAMYWFAEPVGDSIREWLRLGATTEAEGRRPDLAWTTRRLTGFFVPDAGMAAVADDVTVTPAALPYRAHRGVLLELVRLVEPGGAAVAAAVAQWRDDVAEVRHHPGVAGTWTFTGHDLTFTAADGTTRRIREAGRCRIALHYCTTDPVGLATVLDRPVPAGMTPMLRTPLASITPFEWDWFEVR